MLLNRASGAPPGFVPALSNWRGNRGFLETALSSRETGLRSLLIRRDSGGRGGKISLSIVPSKSISSLHRMGRAGGFPVRKAGVQIPAGRHSSFGFPLPPEIKWGCRNEWSRSGPSRDSSFLISPPISEESAHRIAATNGFRKPP